MINSRGWLFVFLLTAFLVMCAVNARSADAPRLPAGYTCSDVIENVKRYGYWPALLWAKAMGYKPAEIEAAKRCLRSGR